MLLSNATLTLTKTWRNVFFVRYGFVTFFREDDARSVLSMVRWPHLHVNMLINLLVEPHLHITNSLGWLRMILKIYGWPWKCAWLGFSPTHTRTHARTRAHTHSVCSLELLPVVTFGYWGVQEIWKVTLSLAIKCHKPFYKLIDGWYYLWHVMCLLVMCSDCRWSSGILMHLSFDLPSPPLPQACPVDPNSNPNPLAWHSLSTSVKARFKFKWLVDIAANAIHKATLALGWISKFKAWKPEFLWTF